MRPILNASLGAPQSEMTPVPATKGQQHVREIAGLSLVVGELDARGAKRDRGQVIPVRSAASRSRVRSARPVDERHVQGVRGSSDIWTGSPPSLRRAVIGSF